MGDFSAIGTSQSVAGSTIAHEHTERIVVCYAIQEDELRTIGLVNHAVTALASVSVLFGTLAWDLYKDIQFAPEVDHSLLGKAVLGLALVAIVADLGAAMLMLWRHNTINMIRKQTRSGHTLSRATQRSSQSTSDMSNDPHQ